MPFRNISNRYLWKWLLISLVMNFLQNWSLCVLQRFYKRYAPQAKSRWVKASKSSYSSARFTEFLPQESLMIAHCTMWYSIVQEEFAFEIASLVVNYKTSNTMKYWARMAEGNIIIIWFLKFLKKSWNEECCSDSTKSQYNAADVCCIEIMYCPW